MKKQEEEFRDIPGFEGYQVSNLGRVKSLARVVKKGTNHFSVRERILKPSINVHGYYRLSLKSNTKRKPITIHQLVAIAFLGHTPNGNKMVVDHINSNKVDNRLENLQIITQRENVFKDIKNKTSKYPGVSWDKSRNKWTSRFTLKNKYLYLGRFNTELEAHNAYQNKLSEINSKLN